MSTEKIVFPPYGFLNAVERLTPHEPLFPPDYKLGKAAWQKWFAATLEIIKDRLWPEWKDGKWVGKSVAQMMALTQTDLEILHHIRSHKPLVFDQEVTTPVGPLGRQTHRQLFRLEDGYIEVWGTNYGSYDVTLPQSVSTNLPAIITAAAASKCGDTDVYFKRRLQRPRPYQTSYLLAKKSYDYEEAHTANTPSMCCGHCLQSLLSVGSVMESILDAGITLSDGSWTALRQFAVDIGDRRVMAGVHYPSDALCSWIILLRIANDLFHNRDVKPLLWKAIQQGAIYQIIQKTIENGHGDVYKPAMRALFDAAK